MPFRLMLLFGFLLPGTTALKGHHKIFNYPVREFSFWTCKGSGDHVDITSRAL